eukprot:SAG11_NODE_20900_length_436_cov_0.768546_1_plen_58_part_01
MLSQFQPGRSDGSNGRHALHAASNSPTEARDFEFSTAYEGVAVHSTHRRRIRCYKCWR